MNDKVKYPIWWSNTLTIYNKYTDPQTKVIKWYRTVLQNCFWGYDYLLNESGAYIARTNQVVCRIPKDPKFLPFADWRNVENDKMGEYFTLKIGDIVVDGEVEEEIDEYTSGKHSTDFIKKYKEVYGCIKIDALSLNVGPGRVLEHYYVRGR